MGNWRIVIEGVGAHHNGMTGIITNPDGTETRYTQGIPSNALLGIDEKNVRWEANIPYDANVMTTEFVQELKNKGHNIKQASFEILYGQKDYL
jgi:hypothetical protein